MKKGHLTGWVALFCLAVGSALTGCASDDASGARPGFPSALGARWSPPAFAMREVEGGREAIFDACIATANSLGFAVVRLDEASGKISAARRQTASFDGARQDTLEITVTALDGFSAQVALAYRETVESGADDERSGGFVSSGFVRDRAAYDVFFDRLAAALRGGPAS